MGEAGIKEGGREDGGIREGRREGGRVRGERRRERMFTNTLSL